MVLDHKIATFLEVCRQGNFTKAAEHLYITQPAVTQQMRALEEYYECKLFNYVGKKLCLTKQGEELYHYALTMQANQQKIKERVRLSGQSKQQLTFGATLTLGEFVLPHMVIEYLKENPDIELAMHVNNTMELLAQLKNGDIDFAFIEGYYEKEGYDIVPFFQDSFIGVCSSNSPLRNQVVSIEDLYSSRLILREDGSGTREVLERTLALTNHSIEEWNHIAKIGNINAIKEMVKADVGITFLYESAVVKEIAEGSLCKLFVNDFEVTREYTIVSLKESNLMEHRDQLLQWFEKMGTAFQLHELKKEN